MILFRTGVKWIDTKISSGIKKYKEGRDGGVPKELMFFPLRPHDHNQKYYSSLITLLTFEVTVIF